MQAGGQPWDGGAQTEHSLRQGTKQNKSWKKHCGILMNYKFGIGANAQTWCCSVVKSIRWWVCYVLFV